MLICSVPNILIEWHSHIAHFMIFVHIILEVSKITLNVGNTALAEYCVFSYNELICKWGCYDNLHIVVSIDCSITSTERPTDRSRFQVDSMATSAGWSPTGEINFGEINFYLTSKHAYWYLRDYSNDIVPDNKWYQNVLRVTAIFIYYDIHMFGLKLNKYE